METLIQEPVDNLIEYQLITNYKGLDDISIAYQTKDKVIKLWKQEEEIFTYSRKS